MALTLNATDTIHAVGRLKDGDLWFDYGYGSAGNVQNRKFYTRYFNGLLVVEIEEGSNGRTIKTLRVPCQLHRFAFRTAVATSVRQFGATCW